MNIKQLLKSSSIYPMLRLMRDTKTACSMFDVHNKLASLKGILEANKMYGWNPDEYFLYHYPQLSDSARKSFIGEREHVVMSEWLNSVEVRKVLADKWNTYVVFNSFFKRKAARVMEGGDFIEFKSLLAESGKLILKPFDGSFGKGIQIVTQEGMNEMSFNELIKDYPNGFIAEQLIQQDERMAVLHPESVNTLRIHTIQYGGKIVVFHPYVRIGRGASFVDNAGSGGVFTSCNPDTGEILSIVDESGHAFTEHPDNHFPLLGYKIPCWKEAFDFAQQLAAQLPDLHYAGWDIALTDNGWVLVEGNPRAQLIFQISEQKGFRTEMDCILNEMGITERWG